MEPIKLMPSEERLRQTLYFLLRFLALSFPLYAVLISGISLEPLQRAVYGSTFLVLTGMGLDVESQGLVMIIAGDRLFAFSIGPDCTGWKSYVLFFALVFATPGAGMRKRLAGMALALPAIYLGNIARIVGVVMVERGVSLGAALALHDFLWQAGLLSLVLALWLAWLRWARPRPRQPLLRIRGIIKHIIGQKKE
jgi:exosortase/archaeosortase family protein